MKWWESGCEGEGVEKGKLYGVICEEIVGCG